MRKLYPSNASQYRFSRMATVNEMSWSPIRALIAACLCIDVERSFAMRTVVGCPLRGVLKF